MIPPPLSEVLIALILGFLLDQILGDPRSWPHPVRWIGLLIQFFEDGFSYAHRTRENGVWLLLSIVMTVSVFVWVALFKAGRWDPYCRLALSVLLIYYGLAARSLARETEAVLESCEGEDWPEARRRLSGIVGRDTAELPPEEIYRACIETVAENATDGVVSPLFYAAIAGPVGLWVFKAISTLDSMVGYRTEKYREFGWFSARADDVANFLPARLTWLLLALAASTCGRFRQAVRIGWRDGRKHPSPNAAWGEATMAGALDVQLGGPATYQGKRSEKPLLGDKGAALTISTVRQAIRLMLATSWLSLVVALALTSIVFGWLLPMLTG